jgi:hypothetical protein
MTAVIINFEQARQRRLVRHYPALAVWLAWEGFGVACLRAWLGERHG